MLKQRIIPCLDVLDDKVVKGVAFKQHEIVGDIVTLAQKYCDEGADELVFYDITASSEQRVVKSTWVKKISDCIDIPFCVAGGIKSIDDAEKILAQGADKISINSPAIENPQLITELAQRFGQQCVVVGVDSFEQAGEYFVYQYTGDAAKTRPAGIKTFAWIEEVIARGAGEIVVNCMNQDGVRRGYDVRQLAPIAEQASIPIIASGGAGTYEHFKQVFEETKVSGALAASVFHKNLLNLPQLKQYLAEQSIKVRPC
jgi:cyclase